MSVSNYLAKSDGGCYYKYHKLKDRIYLLDETHSKNIHIDNGEAYIDGITDYIYMVEGFNLQFKEETSLDERYKFQKNLSISYNGYARFTKYKWEKTNPQQEWICENGDKYEKEVLMESYDNLTGRFYAIIETMDGTFYLVNVDFPGKITHTYTLNANQNQTDFSLTSQSNFPTLELKNFNPRNIEILCKNYIINSVDGLLLLEKVKANISDTKSEIVLTENWKTVEYLKNSLSLQELYDGEKFQTTLEFKIRFDNYKTSWHYNLLEFTQNTYVAKLGIKNSDEKVYIGFENGLMPNYTIEATSQKNQETDIITITMMSLTNNSLTMVAGYKENISTEKSWRYISWINGQKAYECVGGGRGLYLLQEEIDVFGNATGRYKVFEGHYNDFPNLNIIETFSNEKTFYSPECTNITCKIYSDAPSIMYFKGQECQSFSLSADCAWSVVDVPSNITVSPSTGNADTLYTINVCNTQTPTEETLEGYFIIRAGQNELFVNTNVNKGIYKTMFDGNYYCIEGNKYEANELFVSYDGGQTWERTYQAVQGNLVETNSKWCQDNPPIYSWRLTDEWACADVIPIYRWVSSGRSCIGYDMWNMSIHQVSYNEGETWNNVSPAEYSATSIYEYNSMECGYVPSTLFLFNNGQTYAGPTVGAEAGYYQIGIQSSIEGVVTGFTASESCGWIDNDYTATTTSFRFKYDANTSQNSRTCVITLEQNGSHARITLEINQSGQGQQGETYCRWGWAGHYSDYSADVKYNDTLLLVPIQSKVNGVDTNVVISSDKSWVITDSDMYYNRNEFRPEINNYLYFEGNETDQDRTATVTFTQKGTTNKIKLYVTQKAYEADCTLQTFSFDYDEVCKGDDLTYSYTVKDPRCSSKFYFQFWDKAGTLFDSESTPSNGSGTGSFTTTNMATGEGTCDVTIKTTPVRLKINIKDCSPTPPPVDTGFTITMNIKNATTANTVNPSYIDFYTPLHQMIPVYLNQILKINRNQTVSVTATLSNDYLNKNISSIIARDTSVAHMGYFCSMTGESSLKDGGVYNINIEQAIG